MGWSIIHGLHMQLRSRVRTLFVPTGGGSGALPALDTRETAAAWGIGPECLAFLVPGSGIDHNVFVDEPEGG